MERNGQPTNETRHKALALGTTRGSCSSSDRAAQQVSPHRPAGWSQCSASNQDRWVGEPRTICLPVVSRPFPLDRAASPADLWTCSSFLRLYPCIDWILRGSRVSTKRAVIHSRASWWTPGAIQARQLRCTSGSGCRSCKLGGFRHRAIHRGDRVQPR